MKKSKSLFEEVDDAVMIRSPWGSNFNAGNGKLSICAAAEFRMASKSKTVRALIFKVLPKASALADVDAAPDRRIGVDQGLGSLGLAGWQRNCTSNDAFGLLTFKII